MKLLNGKRRQNLYIKDIFVERDWGMKVKFQTLLLLETLCLCLLEAICFFSWFWKWKTDKQNKTLPIDTISYFATVYSNIWVVILRATCRTFQPRHKKPKKSTPKKFLKFPEMDLSSSHIKKILIVSVWHNRTFLCFRKGIFKILAWRNFLLFLGMEFFLIFQKM